MTGVSPLANIPAPCAWWASAWWASSSIFGGGMRTRIRDIKLSKDKIHVSRGCARWTRRECASLFVNGRQKRYFLSFSFGFELSHPNHGIGVHITPKACISFATCCGISSMRSIVYHHCERRYSLRLMIYTYGDEIHAHAWWYAIAFAMDKKRQVETCRFLVDPRGIEPLSENLLIWLSPGAFCPLEFPSSDAGRQASDLGSHFLHGRFNGETPTHVHRSNDAQSKAAILLGGTGGFMPRHCP